MSDIDPAGQGPQLSGIPFTKMTGSGNDFVFFDGRSVDRTLVASPEAIRRICNRNNGIGADGVVVLEPASGDAHVAVHYFNSDGTPADLCGNATLCSTALSAHLGLAPLEGMALRTGSGIVASRVGTSRNAEGHRETVAPEIDLQPVTDIREAIAVDLEHGEHRVGYAMVGVPHLVILCDDADRVDVSGRGPGLRRHPALGAAGANVNWVSPLPGGHWRYRTFERGVEGETQACGTGAVATAILLSRWGLAGSAPVVIRTSSGRDLVVRLAPAGDGTEAVRPSLRGEGRIVFAGRIESV